MECLTPFDVDSDGGWKLDGFLLRGRAATSVLPIKQRFNLEPENESDNKKRNNSTSE